MSENKNELVGFKLPQNSIMRILTHLEGSGKSAAGEKAVQAEDCVIHVKKNSLWAVTVDKSRKIIMQAKVNKISGLQTINVGKIPVDIDMMMKYLKRFSSNDDIEVIYENGMIALIKTEDKLENPIKVRAFFAAKRMSAIQNDFIMGIQNTIKGKGLDKDKKLLEFFKTNISIYTLDEEAQSVDVLGTVLDTFVELSCSQLKAIIADGELLENRVYPFSVKNNVFNITTKSRKDNNQNRVERDIYIKKAKYTGDFEQTYSSILSSAIASTSGHVELYFGFKKPLLLRKTSATDKGLDLVYMIVPFFSKK